MRHLYCTFRFSGVLDFSMMRPARVHFAEMFTEDNMTICFMKFFTKIAATTISRVISNQVRLLGPVYVHQARGIGSFVKSPYYQIIKSNYMLDGYSEWNAVDAEQMLYDEEVERLQNLHEEQLRRIKEQRAFEEQIRLHDERKKLAQEEDDVTWRTFLRDDVEW